MTVLVSIVPSLKSKIVPNYIWLSETGRMTRQYWSLCDKKSYNVYPHTLPVRPALENDIKRPRKCWVYSASKPITHRPLVPSVLVLMGGRCPLQPTQCGHHHHYAPAEIRAEEKPRGLSSVEELHHLASQHQMKYKIKDIILRIVSLKVIIPDRSGWLFKFLKTAEECKVGAQTRAAYRPIIQ